MNRTECNISEPKCIKIYNQRLAGYLMMNGFPLRFLLKEENTLNKFLFDNNERVRNAVAEWHKSKS